MNFLFVFDVMPSPCKTFSLRTASSQAKEEAGALWGDNSGDDAADNDLEEVDRARQ